MGIDLRKLLTSILSLFGRRFVAAALVYTHAVHYTEPRVLSAFISVAVCAPVVAVNHWSWIISFYTHLFAEAVFTDDELGSVSTRSSASLARFPVAGFKRETP